ncbi:ferrochelatase [Sphingobium sp. CCH11-B1]|jgi:ferrochelatase|uniref:ferrochelatase n=1 Tax=Sphingobium sp. CCH11-B1 TaxID=1768781 RepID=UPI0008329C23|nr:ferrochelatase [Sphingobium sp. CCH11-B1]MEA3387675.1 ferrochelatase [Pseudomonadota bacterium]
MILPPDHPAIATPKVGVLLINLGTPDAPDAASVRRYLREFLSDRRVVEIPRILWQPILHGAILTTRPKKSAHAYSQVWTEEGSPLAVHTRATAQAMQAAMGQGVVVDWAMRYGNPGIAERLAAMKQAGCERILIAPLYPQYSAATTATANDAAFAALAAMRWQPAIRTLPPYHDDPAYIAALKMSVERSLAGLDFAPDALLASFHGMPERTLRLGDPYHCQSVKTVRLLREALSLPVHMSFQSRFGRAKWLEPETEATLAGLVRGGVRNIAVVTPGFAADCLETLEEIALRARDAFLREGGEKFVFLPCLNASAEAITLYQRLLSRELSGWID